MEDVGNQSGLAGAVSPRIAAGTAATASLHALNGGKTVRLEFTAPRKRDNFGRLLCRVFVGDVDVGRWMIENGHAKVYVPRR